MSEEMTLETLRLRTAALHRVCASLAGWRERAEKAEAKVAAVEALAESAGDLDNGILVWDLRRALGATS